MYGTNGASMHWEEEYVGFMLSAVFVRGMWSPCLFDHPGKDIRAGVYGDDFAILGAQHHLAWFKAQIERTYVIDFKARLGPHEGDTKVVRLLNRVTEWKHDGIYMDSDPRHADIIVKKFELEMPYFLACCWIGSARRPDGVRVLDVKERVGQDASSYRAIVARGNYLSPDGNDIRYAVKEYARRMSKPRNIDYKQLTQSGRYLRGKMRVVSKYGY